MNKYLSLLRITITQALQYRAEIFIWILLDIFPTVILAITWITIFQGRELVGGKTLSQLLTYYFAVLIILNLTESHFENRWVDHILHGKIDHFFAKPLHLLLWIFFQEIGAKIFSFILFILPFSLFVGALIKTGIYQIPAFFPFQIPMFVLFILLAFLSDALLSFFVIFAAFWMEEARSLSHAKMMLIGLFGGALAPLSFYPEWIQKMAEVLPFKRMIATPALLLTEQSSLHYFAKELGILFVFTVILFIMFGIFWKLAKRKYSSAGG